jgi:hypothetical protein
MFIRACIVVLPFRVSGQVAAPAGEPAAACSSRIAGDPDRGRAISAGAQRAVKSVPPGQQERQFAASAIGV